MRSRPDDPVQRPTPPAAHDHLVEEASRALLHLDRWHPPGTSGPSTSLPRPIPVLCRVCWVLDEPAPSGSWCQCRPDRPAELTALDHPRLTLCLVCAGEVLPWCSRFSMVLCTPCADAASELNRQIGVLAIPLGRHPWVNGQWLVAAGHSPWPDGTNGLERAGWMTRRLSPWCRQLTREHCADRGLVDGRDVPLPRYRLALEEHPVDRAGAFEGALVHLAGRARSNETRSWS